MQTPAGQLIAFRSPSWAYGRFYALNADFPFRILHRHVPVLTLYFIIFFKGEYYENESNDNDFISFDVSESV